MAHTQCSKLFDRIWNFFRPSNLTSIYSWKHMNHIKHNFKTSKQRNQNRTRKQFLKQKMNQKHWKQSPFHTLEHVLNFKRRDQNRSLHIQIHCEVTICTNPSSNKLKYRQQLEKTICDKRRNEIFWSISHTVRATIRTNIQTHPTWVRKHYSTLIQLSTQPQNIQLNRPCLK